MLEPPGKLRLDGLTAGLDPDSGQPYGPIVSATLLDKPADFPAGHWLRLRVQAIANRLRAWSFDQPLLDMERATVDYRFEHLDRACLAADKLALRQARADHDAAFRALAEAIQSPESSAPSLLYLPLAPHLELYRLEDAAGQVFGLWLRSPENLDLWQDVLDEQGDPTSEHVGRTKLKLERQQANNWEAPAFEVEVFHDADSTQVLLLLRDGDEWPAGTYRLTFRYHRNHGDETGAGDHRYDRPVKFRQGKADPEEESLQLTM